MILERDADAIADAMIVLDESVKSKQSKQLLATSPRKALNAHPGAPKIRGVRYHDSRSDNLIQVTDMICGAIYHGFERANAAYPRELRLKIADLWIWPPREAQ